VLKLIFIILVAVMATILAMNNMHHVELSLVVGRPVHVRLFFLLLTCFLIGCFSAMLMTLYHGMKSGKKRGIAQDEGEEFFVE
jgi:uncharacterized integral membrane protein